MSETRRARNAFFYALAAYILVCWLAANWPRPDVPLATEVQAGPRPILLSDSFFVNILLSAPRFVDLVFTLLVILGHVFRVIGSALNPLLMVGCG
jgi:hypothetical protein